MIVPADDHRRTIRRFDGEQFLDKTTFTTFFGVRTPLLDFQTRSGGDFQERLAAPNSRDRTHVAAQVEETPVSSLLQILPEQPRTGSIVHDDGWYIGQRIR